MRGAELAFLGVLWAGICTGTTWAPLEIPELTRRASLVVYGRVVQIEVEAADGRRTAVLEPLEILKGEPEWGQQREFLIPLMNRARPHSDIVEYIPGAPELKWGEEVLVFLKALPAASQGMLARKDGRPIFILEGLQQGHWSILQNPRGQRFALSWDQQSSRLHWKEISSQKTTPRRRLKDLKTQSVEEGSLPTAVPSLDQVLNQVRGALSP